jgi:hypothetical protein
MLNNLTHKLLQDDASKLDRELLIEGVMLPTKISTISRYSLLEGSDECCDADEVQILADKLKNVAFPELSDLEERKKLVYAAAN